MRGPAYHEVTSMNVAQIMASLNSIQMGDLEVIAARLEQAREACSELGHDDLAGKLEEAKAAFEGADIKLFRKRVDHVVARLGHLK